ncbi:hypothetical protein IGI47_001368 [Enterococcus sp. AZ191]
MSCGCSLVTSEQKLIIVGGMLVKKEEKIMEIQQKWQRQYGLDMK